eukprot:9100134-Heterocapsa_arctica.AAC.1
MVRGGTFGFGRHCDLNDAREGNSSGSRMSVREGFVDVGKRVRRRIAKVEVGLRRCTPPPL